MNENYQLETAKLPNIFTALSYSNQFLKLFSLLSMGMNILMILSIIGLGYKKPIVIPLSSNAQILATTNLPKAELEISAAIKKYLELRYNWDQTTVSKQLGAAESFIQGSELKVFRTAMSSVAKFSTEKLVSQKVYPSQN